MSPRKATPYQIGKELERAARIYLAASGYETFPSAGSKTKVDLIAFKPGEILFVQCKTGGACGPAERGELRRLAAMVGAVPLVCGWHKEGAQARVPAFRRPVGEKPALWPAWTPDHAFTDCALGDAV